VPKATNWRVLGASERELAMYPQDSGGTARAQTPTTA
jgi:hypothetical protein